MNRSILLFELGLKYSGIWEDDSLGLRKSETELCDESLDETEFVDRFCKDLRRVLRVFT